ncbi:uncharacterized protein N7482_001668, partial [Penicillium canariense]
ARMLIHFLLVLCTLWQSGVADSDNCSSSVTISSQSDANNLASCDTLDGSVTISSSVSGVITLNNVAEIKGSFTMEGASGLTKLIVPDLETLQGALTLVNLESLTDLTMSALSEVSSGIIITGNSMLKSLNLEKLEKVDGQLELTGSFTSVSLPSLDEVKGQTTIRGAKVLSCKTLDSLQSEGVYQGAYSCTATDSSGASLSPGTKGGIAVGVIVGVILILLLLWYVLRRRRNRKNRSTSLESSSSPPSVVPDEKQPSRGYQPVPLQESKPMVPREPIGPAAAQLDHRSIYEAPVAPTPVREYHELDAGPVFSSHQRPIYPEA